jgi:hypothetical protein
MAYMVRHLAGDWGDLDEHDRSQTTSVSFTGFDRYRLTLLTAELNSGSSRSRTVAR